MTPMFERAGYHSLVLTAVAGFFGRQNFGMRRHKAAQKLRVFVIHVGNFFTAEQADFFSLLLDSHINRISNS